MRSICNVSAAVAALALSTTHATAAQPPESDTATAAIDDDDIILVNGQLLEAPVATKADIPALENSQAISVVAIDQIEVQGLRRLGDVLLNVAGVSRSNNYGFFDGFNIRGFNASTATYIDGLLDDSGYATTEMSVLEQVEVVKGPASGLFGQGPISGLVNLVSKRPQEEAFLDVGAAIGSYAFKEVTLDANAPLTKDGTVLARLAAVYRDQDFFVDFSGQRRIMLAPSITWKPGERTMLTLIGRYLDDHINPWSPTTAYGTALYNPNGPLPLERAVNDGEYPAVQDNTYRSLGYVFDHKFSEAIQLHQSLRYLKYHNTWDNWLFVTDISADRRTVTRAFYGPFSEHGEYFRVDTNVSARFDTGPLNHYVLLGLDYGARRLDNVNLYDVSMPYSLDLYNPVYGSPSTHNPTQPFTTYAGRVKQRGIYVQDHIKIGERIAITLGGRWDYAISQTGTAVAMNARITDTAFSPRAGATFQLTNWVSAYVNYAKSFNPQGSFIMVDGSTAPPENGVNYEGGFKLASPDGKLTGMVTVFELTRTNVATADAVLPNRYVLTGQQRSRGIEAEAAWRPAPGVELTGAFTYMDAVVTDDNRLKKGSRLGSIPEYVVNLWARYTLQSGPLEGLGAGMGVHHEGQRLANTASAVVGAIAPFSLDPYTLVDGGLFYTNGDWSLQANVRNVFNARYFPTASLTRTTPGEPRTFTIRASRRF